MQRNLQLEALIQPIVVDMGYDFIGLEYAPSHQGTLLRIYIDSKAGIKVEDCKEVSYRINNALSVENELTSNYTLEVSSPGLNRKLYSVAQCQEQIGKVIKLSLSDPIEAQRNFKGVLQKIVGEQLLLKLDDGREMMFNFADVNRAQVVPEW